MKTVEFSGKVRRIGRTDDATCAVEIVVKDDSRETDRHWLQFSTADVQSWTKVRKAIFSATNLFYDAEVPRGTTPQIVWERTWNSMENDLAWEEAPPEASESGLTLERCMEFVSTLRVAETAAEFEAGGWRYETPSGLTIFRARDLRHHLEATGKPPAPRDLWAVLSANDFGSGVQRVGTRTFKVWWVTSNRLLEWTEEVTGTADVRSSNGSGNGHVTDVPAVTPTRSSPKTEVTR